MDNPLKKFPYRAVLFLIILVGIGVFFLLRSPGLRTERAPDANTIARVGSDTIVREDYNKHLATAGGVEEAKVSEVKDEKLRQQVLDRLIESKLIRQKAKELGLTVSSSEIDAQLQKIAPKAPLEHELARYNAETALLRAKLQEKVIERRSGKYIQIRFDRYFDDDLALSEKEINRIRENRERLNQEERAYADQLIQDLDTSLHNGSLSFDEAMQRVKNDPHLRFSDWEPRGVQLVGTFNFDGSVNAQMFAGNPFYMKAYEVKKAGLVGPYLHELMFSADPTNPGDPQKMEKKPAMWVLLDVETATQGEARSMEQWLSEEALRKNVRRYSVQSSGLLPSVIHTAYATHTWNPANACDPTPRAGEGSHSFAEFVVKTMFYDTAGGGPYDLGGTTVTISTAPGAQSYSSGCTAGSSTKSGGPCFVFNGLVTGDGKNWCCGGLPGHNPHTITISGLNSSLYYWSYYDSFTTNDGSLGHVDYLKFVTTTMSFLTTAVNGETVFIDAYAQQVPVPASPVELQAICPQPGNKAVLGWKENPFNFLNKGFAYQVRIDNLANGWNGSCDHPNDGDLCMNTTSTLTYFWSRPGNTYNFWVHSCNFSGCSGASQVVKFTCWSCTPKAKTACYDNDVYWFDACGNRQEKAQECGVDSTGAWSLPYCKDGNLFHKRTHYTRGCNSTGEAHCFENTQEEERVLEMCSFGCSGGVCQGPSVGVDLTAAPTEGKKPLSVTLNAAVGGTATGPITYNLWWNCGDTRTTVSDVEQGCGALPSPAAGSCAENINGKRCASVSYTTMTTTHTYNALGNMSAKALVQRSPAPNAEDREIIIVTLVSHIPKFLPDPFEPLDALKTAQTFPQKISGVFEVFAWLAIPATVLMMIIGSFTILIAGSNPERAVLGKNILKYGFIGFAIVLTMFGVARGVLSLLS